MREVNHLTRLGFAVLLLAVWSVPAMSQDSECDNIPAAAPNAPVPAGGPFTCPNGAGLLCDLGMQVTVLASGEQKSDDLRIGDPVDAALPRKPRIIFDSAGNRFYAKLYARFNNLEAVPALVDAPVTVTFSFKSTNDPTDVAGPWTGIDGNVPHTAGGTYTMRIPASLAAAGALYGGAPYGPTHIQNMPVCWHSAPNTLLPLRFMLRAELSWAGSAESNLTNNVAYRYYDLAEEKQAADIGLVLDLSGSMSTTMPSGLTRLAVAQDRAREFVQLIEDGDRLGVYGFATGNSTGSPPNSNFIESYRDAANGLQIGVFSDTSVVYAPKVLEDDAVDPLDTADSKRLAARTAISAQTDHGCTPVGQGLLRAKDGFAAGPARTKSIVLFSDGLQNVKPFVNTGPLYDCGGPGAAVAIDATNTFNPPGEANDIEIYSIFFGNVGYGLNLMNEIKNQTGGDFVYGASTGLELANVYYSIRNLLDDLLYLKEDGRTSGFGPGPPFSVYFDAAATKGTIGIAWPLEAGARLTVERRLQGQTDWQRFDEPTPTAGVPVFGGTTHFQANQDAHRVYRFTPGPDTEWEFRVVQLAPQNGQVDFALAVYSDVESARLQAELDAEDFTAGDDLAIYGHLRRAGHPIPGAQVQAVVRVPERAFSTTLRRYAGRFTATGGGDAGPIPAMTAQLRQFLEQDGESDELLLYRDITVTMRDDGQGGDVQAGDGVYTGVLAGTETRVAGDVQVTIRASGTTPSGFAFERIAKLGTVAGVGPADPSQSDIRVVTGKPTGDGVRIATITVLPTDKFGNAAFPGSGGNILVRPRAGGGIPSGNLIDNLDSTFTQTLLLQPGQEPDLEVSVGDVVIGEVVPPDPGGPTFPGYDRREASFHLGLAEPHGRFAGFVDAGLTFGVDWAYRFSRDFALRVDLGLSQFDLPSGGEIEMVHLVPYLQYRWPGANWVPYFEAGPGFYDLESTGSGPGFSAGVGAHRPLSGNWRLDLSLHGHRAGGNLDLGYSLLRVGVLYTY